jgi:hypothetical protein
MAMSSDKLEILVKMKNLMYVLIRGLGKNFHGLKIPNFLCTSDLTQSILARCSDTGIETKK